MVSSKSPTRPRLLVYGTGFECLFAYMPVFYFRPKNTSKYVCISIGVVILYNLFWIVFHYFDFIYFRNLNCSFNNIIESGAKNIWSGFEILSCYIANNQLFGIGVTPLMHATRCCEQAHHFTGVTAVVQPFVAWYGLSLQLLVFLTPWTNTCKVNHDGLSNRWGFQILPV